MKKVLFVLGNFFPVPSANAICCMEIMQQLQSAGCEVHCIANQFLNEKRYATIQGVHTYRVRVPLNYSLNKKYNQEKSAFQKHLLRPVLKVVNLYYRLLSAFHFPFLTMRFSSAVQRKAKAILEENGIDTVVCVNQPATSLYVGCKLKKRFPHVRWVAYLLDPIKNGLHHSLLSQEMLVSRLQSLQNNVLSTFDLVVAQNEHEKLFDDVKDTASKAKIHYLGAPLLVEKNVCAQKLDLRKKVVIYAGGLSSTRSPAFIAEAFRYAHNAVLHIYTNNQSSWLKEIVHGNPNVVLHKAIARSELLTLMKGADALLSIGNTQSEYAPSKIIECISFGKPLIATYRTDDDACRPYMEKYPQGLYLDERAVTPEEAASKLESLLNYVEKELDFSELEKIYWDNTPSAFIDLAKSTGDPPSTHCLPSR